LPLSPRRSSRNAFKKIKKINKSTQKPVRFIIDVMGNVSITKTTHDTQQLFMTNYKKDALQIKMFTMTDGTFIYMYAEPDHQTDIEPWFIFNSVATRLALEPTDIQLEDGEILDIYNLPLENTVNGVVMLQRVDEDGDELGMNYSHYQELLEDYICDF
jgi:hypothetical protein